MNIKLVPKGLIDDVWPFIVPLAKDLEHKTAGEHTPASLYEQVKNGHDLWVAHDEQGHATSFVTTFIAEDGSSRKIGVMLASAGEKGKIEDWKDHMEGAIAEWFKERGCHKSVFVGPKAWAKYFPNFKIKSVIFERQLEN